MSVTRFQQLGAFVGSAVDLSDNTIAKFAAAGGRWVIVLLAQLGYPDDHDPACVWNLQNITSLKERLAEHGVACGGWFNGWAGGSEGTTPEQDAAAVAAIVDRHGIGPVVLDLEAAYQYPGGDCGAMPRLLAETRRLLPSLSIGVSTNGPNDSMLWNGGQQTGPQASLRALRIRLLPQWYNGPPYASSPWMQPPPTMQWLQTHGTEDNLHDPKAKDGRAVPLSFVHGTLEVTGDEGADLAGGLRGLAAAKSYGYTTGMSIYTLESASDADLDLLAAQRGKLFLA